MPLFHIQDNDRPAWVVADDWNHAIKKWEKALVLEYGEDEMEGGIEPPLGIQLVCEDRELIVGTGFLAEAERRSDIDRDKDIVDDRVPALYHTLASMRERLCELGRSKHIQLQSDVDEIHSLAGTVNTLIGMVLGPK